MDTNSSQLIISEIGFKRDDRDDFQTLQREDGESVCLCVPDRAKRCAIFDTVQLVISGRFLTETEQIYRTAIYFRSKLAKFDCFVKAECEELCICRRFVPVELCDNCFEELAKTEIEALTSLNKMKNKIIGWKSALSMDSDGIKSMNYKTWDSRRNGKGLPLAYLEVEQMPACFINKVQAWNENQIVLISERPGDQLAIVKHK